MGLSLDDHKSREFIFDGVSPSEVLQRCRLPSLLFATITSLRLMSWTNMGIADISKNPIMIRKKIHWLS